MTRYRKDPRWIVTRYAGTCQGCAAPIGPGERAFWYPLTRDLLCDSVRCGQREALEFQAAADDEEAYASQYGGDAPSDSIFDAEWASERGEW